MLFSLYLPILPCLANFVPQISQAPIIYSPLKAAKAVSTLKAFAETPPPPRKDMFTDDSCLS
jgi:hypothetical protein